MISWIRGTTSAAALACICAPGLAGAESFADALVNAYRTSPELAAERANVRVAGENAYQARALGRVNVDGSIDLSFQTTDDDNFNLPVALNLDVVQPIYTGGRVANATNAAERRITESEAFLEEQEQQVLFSAAVAYLNVQAEKALVSSARNNVRVLTEQLEAAQERFEVGEVTRTDVEQARARRAASESALAAAIGAFENARDDYRRTVGRDAGDLDPPPPIPDLPGSEEEAVLIGLQNDPVLLAARLEREAAGFDVRSEIADLLPQVSLVGRLSQTNTLDDGIEGFRGASVGVNISIPFYSGGANYSDVREAQALVDNAEADIGTQLREVREAVGEAWSNLRVAKAQIQAGRLEVRAAQLAFEGVQEEAKVGARTTLDVLDAEQEVLDARDGLIDAQRDELISAYQLLEAMGLMTVDHLGLEVGLDDGTSAYYDSVRNRNFGYDQTDDTVWTLGYRP
ncbi:MAG: TolC family outer membrane protein [Pseudomonadota bacterium]